MFMLKTNSQINALLQQIERLKVSCQQFDEQKLFKSERFIRNQHGLFEHHLFRTKSIKLTDYLTEVVENIDSLPPTEHRHAHRFALETIAQQVEAIITALKATSVWQKEQQFKPVARYKKVVKKIIQSSQDLYRELSQNHEFERRLLEMIELRQNEILNCSDARATELNKEILVLHGRLGRCRKAITAVEEKIQLAEKSNR